MARHWIDGQGVAGGGERAHSINPANGEVIGSYNEATEVEAQRAISAALKAFREGPWRRDRRLHFVEYRTIIHEVELDAPRPASGAA